MCAWVKPIGACPNTLGIHNTWEPVIVVPGRRERPGVRDWLSAQPARGGGTLPGRKPVAFCAWLFRCLGMRTGDELHDLFPGTGIVGRSWRELCRSEQLDASSTTEDLGGSGRRGRRSLAPGAGRRPSSGYPGDAEESLEYSGDVAGGR